MSRHSLNQADAYAEDQTDVSGIRRFSERNADQPRRSPIRRKDKIRQKEGFKPKFKRDLKKIQNKIKYDWQGG